VPAWIPVDCKGSIQGAFHVRMKPCLLKLYGRADHMFDIQIPPQLENSLAQVKLDPADNVPMLAPLLDMPLPAERLLALQSEELRRRQLAALTNWVMASA
jgi:hypothetical protein